MFVYMIHKTFEDMEFHNDVWEVHASLTTAKASVEKLIDEPVIWKKSQQATTPPTFEWQPTPNAKKAYSHDGKRMGRDLYECRPS
jgi:hypothetical protein